MAVTQDRGITLRGGHWPVARGPVEEVFPLTGEKEHPLGDRKDAPRGTWQGWHDTGEKAWQGTFDHNSQAIGDWFFWNTKGTLVFRETYIVPEAWSPAELDPVPNLSKDG